MAVRVQSLVNYAVTLTNPAYTLKPFETKIFPDISIITSNLAAGDAAATLTAEVLANIDEYDSSGYVKVSKRVRKLQCATRCKVPITSNGGLKQAMTRSTHKMRNTVGKFQIELPNFYVLSGVETGPGAACDVTASIEYPVGTFTQVKFGGAVIGSIPNNGKLLSDEIALFIPEDEEFYVRVWRNCASGIAYTGGSVPAMATDGFVSSATSTPDLTMGGSINAATVNIYGPVAIVANITGKAVGSIGDSIPYGSTDSTSDGSGDMGYIDKSLAPYLPVANWCDPSDSAALFAISGNRANRLSLMQYVTDLIIAFGTNDLSAGAANTITNFNTVINAITAVYPSMRIFMPTIIPRTTSTDSWATVGNQTVHANEANRIIVNTAIRDGTVSNKIIAAIDIADVVESGRNSGFFAIDTGAATPARTSDGVHMITKTHRKIAQSGAVQVGVFKG